ncbi:hypothetical protein VB715_02025 [Crocosphaera sp. UHCC 0190]|uniref:hypothetical protein n=1 Tax=Crocosphaera sp. UHCC 0190 TaxID=3110246 RepID=UPI002B208CBF|nr:hypothetical protein [Crocosphaera sp. UHCC 0190]MEA5508533.1 hypothetical protein [Crocosphaera sp. UHCC 0190]
MLQYRLPQIPPTVIVFQGLILWVSFFLSPNVLANPSQTEIDKLSDLSVLNSQDNSSLTAQLDPNSPDSISGEKLVNETVQLQQVPTNFYCPDFTPLTNTIKPNISSDDNQNIEVEPTSNCAADLGESQNTTEAFKKFSEPSVIVQESSPKLSQTLPETEETKPVNDNRWHFKLQPYATVPINTYGTVSARGKTVSYHLSLGELLDTLRVTASGRFEGWNGRWGFIIDGYFASLQDIGNLSIERSRTPNPINALNFLLNRNVNSKLQEVVDVLNREIQVAQNIQEVRNSQPLQNLEEQLQTFKTTLVQKEENFRELEVKLQEFQDALITGRQKLEVLDVKLENIQDALITGRQKLEGLDLKVEDLQKLGLRIEPLQAFNISTERLKQIISLQVQDLPKVDDLQALNEQIRNLNKLTDTRQLGEQLIQTRDNLEKLSQEVNKLKEKETVDKEKLQNLENKIEDAKALIDKEIEAINKIQEFQENQTTQQLNTDTRASLQFDQGIYDFALSYHIGDLPSHELPDKPSNRNFPLIWFQPIAGVRLNDISIDIETITNTKIASTLVNIESTTQQNFQKDRTWFEPLLGGKFGIQISDPITFWLRGDASGFGLAGETDISWNLLFGVDWWVHRQMSLQLGYRFYEIDYGNSNDKGEFAFEENLNGPFFSATFHF